MTVFFDLYLFEKDYVEEIKKKEAQQKSGPSDKPIEFEIGATYCRNMTRTTPIFFYQLHELIGLLKAGYAVGASREPGEERLGAADMPDDSVPITIELEGDEPLKGRFVGPDGEAPQFESSSKLMALVDKYAYKASSD